MPKASIEKIGKMKSVEDFSSLMVNTITYSTSIIDHKQMEHVGSQSVLHQVAHKFVLIVNLAEWAEWVKVTGGR